MDVQMYIDQKKELRNILFTYLESTEIDNNDDFQNLINIQKYLGNKEELRHFLLLLLNISNNYHRDSYFIKKIEKILIYFKDLIKQSLNNSTIFNIFRSNKLILLILIESDIITFDESIFQLIKRYDIDEIKFSHFFYPEITTIANKETIQQIKKEILEQNLNIFNNFQEKRRIGENDSYICSLIREDSVEEFISYINKENIKLTSKIDQSIFETNLFLIQNRPTLIEYAAFFGSIQIYQYLRFNQVELKPSLWIYVIHSKNAELIHLLEENEIQPPNNDYIECLLESIKCHHNDIANYIKNNLMDPISDNTKRMNFIEKVFNCSCRYSNYSYFPNDIINLDFLFFYLCINNYTTLVNLFLKSKNFEQNENISKNDTVSIFYKLSKTTKITNDCFQKKKQLVNIAIPSSIKSIGINAFNSCLFLRQISIPSSVKVIKESAFKYCTLLAQVSIPSSVISIGDHAFSYCSSLKQFTIPSSVTHIGNYVFAWCTKLTQVLILSSIKEIRRCTFYNCESLKFCSIPSTVTLIDISAFKNCKSLEKITIPSSVTIIGQETFLGCSLLSEITFELPSKLTTIKFSTFRDCISLKQIQIPSTVKYIESYAFCNCPSLETFSFPTSVTRISYNCFDGCRSLSKVFIPTSVVTIDKNSFKKCSSLKQISIPSSVTSFDKNAFDECVSLKRISIPSGLKIDISQLPHNIKVTKF